MTRRGQANLLSVAVAVVVLTTVTGLGVAVADDALRGADREPVERRAATTISDRLVAGDAPTTVRRGVLRANVTRNLTATRVAELAPPAETHDVRIRLGNRTLVREGGAETGTTVRRAVRIARPVRVDRTYNLNAVRDATVPPGAGRVTVYLRTGPNTTVRTVRADGRVVLHAPTGIEGTATVAVSPHAPTTFRFVTNGSGTNATGRFELTHTRFRTDTATLAVTVDD